MKGSESQAEGVDFMVYAMKTAEKFWKKLGCIWEIKEVFFEGELWPLC